jgi:hypothetical protein
MFLARVTIFVALGFASASTHAQGNMQCPNSKGWQPSPEELQLALQTHKEWLHKGEPAAPGKAILCNADLRGAMLRGANLRGANLRGANLQDADLSEADLTRVNFVAANIAGVNFGRANLSYADLWGARITGARLHYVDLTHAVYAPTSEPPEDYVAGIRGIRTILAPYDAKTEQVDVFGLVQLRELLQRAGLRSRERESTYAIERSKTHHALARWREQPLAAAEALFRLIAFDWTVAYGLHPGRALLMLIALISGFAAVYVAPLATAGRIYRVWPEGGIEELPNTARLASEAKVERLYPRGSLSLVGRAVQFSVLSAFHLGWRELNVGTWLARVQTREYAMRATGWVRVVAGVQSLLSVYLLALWALTYFGRPFQ